jgi:hypothetical protein
LKWSSWGPTIKESLPALVQDLFTFSSKVIKSFIIVFKEHLNIQKKREKSAKKQKFGGRRTPILGRLDKKFVALPTAL